MDTFETTTDTTYAYAEAISSVENTDTSPFLNYELVFESLYGYKQPDGRAELVFNTPTNGYRINPDLPQEYDHNARLNFHEIAPIDFPLFTAQANRFEELSIQYEQFDAVSINFFLQEVEENGVKSKVAGYTFHRSTKDTTEKHQDYNPNLLYSKTTLYTFDDNLTNALTTKYPELSPEENIAGLEKFVLENILKKRRGTYQQPYGPNSIIQKNRIDIAAEEEPTKYMLAYLTGVNPDIFANNKDFADAVYDQIPDELKQSIETLTDAIASSEVEGEWKDEEKHTDYDYSELQLYNNYGNPVGIIILAQNGQPFHLAFQRYSEDDQTPEQIINILFDAKNSPDFKSATPSYFLPRGSNSGASFISRLRGKLNPEYLPPDEDRHFKPEYSYKPGEGPKFRLRERRTPFPNEESNAQVQETNLYNPSIKAASTFVNDFIDSNTTKNSPNIYTKSSIHSDQNIKYPSYSGFISSPLIKEATPRIDLPGVEGLSFTVITPPSSNTSIPERKTIVLRHEERSTSIRLKGAAAKKDKKLDTTLNASIKLDDEQPIIHHPTPTPQPQPLSARISIQRVNSLSHSASTANKSVAYQVFSELSANEELTNSRTASESVSNRQKTEEGNTAAESKTNYNSINTVKRKSQNLKTGSKTSSQHKTRNVRRAANIEALNKSGNSNINSTQSSSGETAYSDISSAQFSNDHSVLRSKEYRTEKTTNKESVPTTGKSNTERTKLKTRAIQRKNKTENIQRTEIKASQEKPNIFKDFTVINQKGQITVPKTVKKLENSISNDPPKSELKSEQDNSTQKQQTNFQNIAAGANINDRAEAIKQTYLHSVRQKKYGYLTATEEAPFLPDELQQLGFYSKQIQDLKDGKNVLTDKKLNLTDVQIKKLEERTGFRIAQSESNPRLLVISKVELRGK